MKKYAEIVASECDTGSNPTTYSFLTIEGRESKVLTA